MQDTTDIHSKYEVVKCPVCSNPTNREDYGLGFKQAYVKCNYCGSTLLVSFEGVASAVTPEKETFPGTALATALSWGLGLAAGGLVGGSLALVFELLKQPQVGMLAGLAITFLTAKTLQATAFARFAERRLAPLAAKDVRNSDACVQVALHAQNRETKEKFLREALLRNPRHRDAIVSLASLLIADKQTSSAVSLLQMLPACWRDPVREKLFAQAYEAEGNSVAAVEHLKNLLSLTNDRNEKEEIQNSITRLRRGQQRR